MWKAIVIALLAFAVLSGCVQSDFDAGYAQAEEIKARFLAEGVAVPESLEAMELLHSELSNLKNAANNTALQDALSIELTKLDASINYEKGRVIMQRLSIDELDCSQVNKALDFLNAATTRAASAVARIDEFQRNYPSEFQKIDLEKKRMEAFGLSVQSTLVYINNLKQLAC